MGVQFGAEYAIEKKWNKVQKYDKTLYTENLSLLVHMPMLGYQDVIEYDREEFVNGIACGERLSTHGFKNIFYWSGKRIIRLEGEKTNIPPIDYPSLPEGYPAYVMWIASTPNGDFRGTFGDEAHPAEFPKEHAKIIRPLTPAFNGGLPFYPKM
jgi:hypothetical protein